MKETEIDNLSNEQVINREELSSEEIEYFMTMYPEDYIRLFNSDPLIPFL